jgi:hypothetical protein
MVENGSLASLVITSDLINEIKEAQKGNEGMGKIRARKIKGEAKEFTIDDDGTIWYGKCLVVPKNFELRQKILAEAHEYQFSIHTGSNKMYLDVRKKFWWPHMKREVAHYVAECDTCQRVKAEYLKPTETLQPLPIPSWKWEDISMDFITGLPHTLHGYNSIWVIVDRLTKSAHFLLVKSSYTVAKYAELYLTKIVCLHGVPKTIVSDRGPQFTAHFWESLHDAMGTTLTFGTAYHPQTDGQTERVNQILEDMLRACTIIYGKDWETCLPFAEFSYNNSFQASIGMSPFEALYGRSCRTPLNWSESGERWYFGPDIVIEAEKKVKMIQERLQTAQLHQKHYADRRRRQIEYKVGDHVYLKVSPFKRNKKISRKG